MKKIAKYLKIWLMTTSFTARIAFSSRFGAFIFLFGKVIRIFLTFIFLILVFSKIKAVEGYSLWQIIFFFLTFNFIDTTVQFFLREVYRFRSYIVTGFFDYMLVRPLSPLFYGLFGGSDILDLPILFGSIPFLIIVAQKVGIITFENIIIYFFLMINSFIIALSFHVFVLGMGTITTAVENPIMLYRDLTQMGRVPVDIYKEPLRGIITFIFPVGIMMTFPAKALMGLLSFTNIIAAFAISALIFFLSLKFWCYSLKNYSSASS